MTTTTRTKAGGFQSIQEAFAKAVHVYYASVDRATAAKNRAAKARAAKAAQRLVAKLDQAAKKAEALARDAWGRVLKQNERWLKFLRANATAGSASRGGRRIMRGGGDSSCGVTPSNDGSSSPFFNSGSAAMVAGDNLSYLGTGGSVNPVLMSAHLTPAGIPQGIATNSSNSFGFF